MDKTQWNESNPLKLFLIPRFLKFETLTLRRNYVRGLIGTTKGGKVRRVDMSAGLQKVLQAYTHPPIKKELAK
jgi:hypothetical protein